MKESPYALKNAALKSRPNQITLSLSVRELRKDAWLTDREIYAFLMKLKHYLKSNQVKINGLNDPAYLTGLHISNTHMKTEPFVEIICSNGNHWVCIAAGLNRSTADISLYDSLPRREIDPQLGSLCSLISVNERLQKGFLTFEVKNIQNQKKNFCGYYALAFAMALCLGLDPELLEFNENELREHFIGIMFKNKDMSMFPFTYKGLVYNTMVTHLFYKT